MILVSLFISRYFIALSRRFEKTWLICTSSPLHVGSSLIGISTFASFNINLCDSIISAIILFISSCLTVSFTRPIREIRRSPESNLSILDELVRINLNASGKSSSKISANFPLTSLETSLSRKIVII